MSGGSFNYLCFANASDIFQKEDDLDDMVRALRELGHLARDVTARTEALLARREEIDAEIEALKDVWQAVEWWQSADWGRDQVFVALGEYRAAQKAAA